MSMYDYPLNLRFKLIALAPRIIVTDNKGKEILFVSQKVFKLKEDVRVYRTQEKQDEVYNIQANKILDFNTRYSFFDSANSQPLGSVKAKAWRSILSATYMVDDASEQQMMWIKEDNPWVKVGDTLFQQVPFVGMLSGYVFNPSYTCYRSPEVDDKSQPVMQIKKLGAFFESAFTIDLLDPEIERDEEVSALLSFMLMVQFMRRRG